LAKDKIPAFGKLMVMPDDGVQPVLGAFDSAQTSLRIKQFAFTSQQLIDSVINTHKREVDVSVMLNPHTSGNARENDPAYKAFQDAGIKVQWTSPDFEVTHEKSFVVDDKTAYILTFNLAEKYFDKRRDYGIAVFDPDLVKEIIDCFDADWARKPFTPNKALALAWSNSDSREKMAEFIDTATESVHVQHQKFVDTIIIEKLIQAQHRGIEVRILSGGLHGLSLTDIPETSAFMRIIHLAGIRLHEQKHPRLHAKLIVVDKKKAFVGSMNIDRHAFDLRRELAAVIDDKEIVTQLLSIYESDWSKSEPFHASDPFEADKVDPGEQYVF